MKRLALLLCLFPALPAAADVILGAQVGRSYLDVHQTAPGVDESDTLNSNTSLGLIIGVGQPGGGSRIIGEWSGYQIGGEVDLSLLNFSYNYFFPALPSSSNLKLRPFVGGELGYGWLDVDAQSFYNGGDDNGLIYGARLGLNLAISQRAEIELGGRYGIVGLDAELAGKLPVAGTAHYEVDSSMGWWLGFNIGL
ncbi:MAG: hypothetical protein ACRERR_07445 [Moraxellaceae bacterium]